MGYCLYMCTNVHVYKRTWISQLGISIQAAWSQKPYIILYVYILYRDAAVLLIYACAHVIYSHRPLHHQFLQSYHNQW